MKTNTVKTTQLKGKVEVNHVDLRKFLLQEGCIEDNDKLSIFVRVPGGGDWSNTSLEIDEETPVIVNYTRTYTE